MTPEQLQDAYRAVHVRTQAIATELDALQALELALDAHARAMGWDIAAIVDPVIEQSVPLQPAGAGANGAAERIPGPVAAAPSAPIHTPAAASRPEQRSQGAPSAVEPPPAVHAGAITCPDCGRDFKQQGYGPHRRSHRGTAVAARSAAKPNRKESFLCPRCGEPFQTRELQMAHLAKGHPPTPAPPTRPFGQQVSIERAGGGLP